VSGAGNFPKVFPGTSAAAPHIAGIAALLWSKDPSKFATEIKNAILNNADPRGDHNIFGSGLANASRAYYSLYPGPTVTSITPDAGINTGPVTITNLSGANFEPNSSVVLTKAGILSINATNVSVVSSSKITCIINITNAESGPWNVTVSNPDGQSGTLINGFYVNVPSSLSVTGITPNTGLNTASVSITNLSGSNLTIAQQSTLPGPDNQTYLQQTSR
jgi:subtilisin family serine protease